MSQEGFEDYINAIYDQKNGTAKSYITAIRIIDQMFGYNDLFRLNGRSITCIDDTELLLKISDYVREQQSLYKKGNSSIFDNVNQCQSSYPGKGFCSAAISQLLNYHKYDISEKEAEAIVSTSNKGTTVSKNLATFFKLDKEGSDVLVATKVRIGQSYFRKMVLANYNNMCCVTGLNIPQTLRASHIVAWAEDKRHRMDPENGLCLSATYDAAFDKHLISFDDDYRMIVSRYIKDFYTSDVTKDYFKKFEGKQISLPFRFCPDKKLLSKHREQLIG